MTRSRNNILVSTEPQRTMLVIGDDRRKVQRHAKVYLPESILKWFAPRFVPWHNSTRLLWLSRAARTVIGTCAVILSKVRFKYNINSKVYIKKKFLKNIYRTIRRKYLNWFLWIKLYRIYFYQQNLISRIMKDLASKKFEKIYILKYINDESPKF